ncbi:MAG TPA: kelch repeat-containing protein [Chitinophagaceae bacterium]|nr:kelch repeat-containing protein [Chitinophagaceae bacterium]
MQSSNTRAGFLHIAIFMIAILSCKKDQPPPPPDPIETPKLTPPVAKAGADAKIFLPDQRQLLLDGSGSYVPNGPGRSLTYTWSKLSGPAVQYFNVHLATASMVIPDSGTYNFELQVKDGQSQVARDTITITAVWGPSCKPGTEMFISGYVLETSLEESVPLDVSVAQGSGKLVFAGGRTEQDDGWGGYDIYSSKIYIYDLDGKTTIKKELSEARGRIGIAVGTDEIFFAGGILLNQVSDVVDIYDRRSGTMTKSNLSVPRSSVSSGIAGNKVFFAGGRNRNNEPSDVVDIYDMSTKTWTVAKLSMPRAGISVVSSNTKLFFAGGNLNQETASGRVDIYDLNTGLWSVVDLPEPRSDISSAYVGNTIVFAGGKNAQFGQKSNHADLLDLNSLAISSDCIVAEDFNSMIYGANLSSAAINGRDLYYLNSKLLTRFEASSKNWSISVLPQDTEWVGLATNETKLFAISANPDNNSNGYVSKISIHRVNF